MRYVSQPRLVLDYRDNPIGLRYSLIKEKLKKESDTGMSDEQRYDILKDTSINVAQYDTNIINKENFNDVDKLQNLYAKEAKPILRKIAEEFKVFGEYENKDINLTFEYSRGGFNESVKNSKDVMTTLLKC